jgi:hypothetical protein
LGGDSSLVSPSHGATIVTATKSANSRLFTDCYPKSAAIAPGVNQIPTQIGAVSARPSRQQFDNLLFPVRYLEITKQCRSLQSKGPGFFKPGPFP